MKTHFFDKNFYTASKFRKTYQKDFKMGIFGKIRCETALVRNFQGQA